MCFNLHVCTHNRILLPKTNQHFFLLLWSFFSFFCVQDWTLWLAACQPSATEGQASCQWRGMAGWDRTRTSGPLSLPMACSTRSSPSPSPSRSSATISSLPSLSSCSTALRSNAGRPLFLVSFIVSVLSLFGMLLILVLSGTGLLSGQLQPSHSGYCSLRSNSSLGIHCPSCFNHNQVSPNCCIYSWLLNLHWYSIPAYNSGSILKDQMMWALALFNWLGEGRLYSALFFSICQALRLCHQDGKWYVY